MFNCIDEVFIRGMFYVLASSLFFIFFSLKFSRKKLQLQHSQGFSRRSSGTLYTEDGNFKNRKIETKEAIKQGVFSFGGFCILSEGEKTTTTFVFFPDSH